MRKITGINVRTTDGWLPGITGRGVSEFREIKRWLRQNLNRKNYSFKDEFANHNISAGTNFIDEIMFENIEDLNFFRLVFKDKIRIQLLKRNENYANRKKTKSFA